MDSLDQRTEKILKILNEYPKGLGFREIMEKLGMNQAPLQRRIEDLRAMNYITISNIKEWKRGRKMVFILTGQGSKQVNNMLDIETILKDVQEKLSLISEKLGNIRTWGRNFGIWDKSTVIEASIRIKRYRDKQ